MDEIGRVHGTARVARGVFHALILGLFPVAIGAECLEVGFVVGSSLVQWLDVVYLRALFQ